MNEHDGIQIDVWEHNGTYGNHRQETMACIHFYRWKAQDFCFRAREALVRYVFAGPCLQNHRRDLKENLQKTMRFYMVISSKCQKLGSFNLKKSPYPAQMHGLFRVPHCFMMPHGLRQSKTSDSITLQGKNTSTKLDYDYPQSLIYSQIWIDLDTTILKGL